jgi:hypothetical protein
MFTGEFAAGAGTFESDIAGINLGLVWLTATTLAFAPQGFITGAPGDPFIYVCEILS